VARLPGAWSLQVAFVTPAEDALRPDEEDKDEDDEHDSIAIAR
jgi:hypothetical protein